jgi:hypothetical protein
MDNKKILMIGGGVAVSAILLYFLLRKRQPTAPVDDWTPAPTQPEPPNPWQVFGGELLSLWQNRKRTQNQTESGSNYTQTEGAAVDQPSYLKRGSKGPKVRALQAWLNQSSGVGLALDSDFGPATEAAVKAEQDPFNQFLFMYPNSIYGRVSKTFYDQFIKSYE